MKYFVLIMLCLFTGLNTACGGCDTEAYVVQNPPLLVVGTDLLDFGELPLNFTASRTVQLANAGQQELVFENITIESDEGVFMVLGSELSILGGQSVDLSINFTPAAAQAYEGVLKLVSNSQNKAETLINLKGEGVEEVICGDCDNPPEQACLDDMTLMIYEQDGECVEGICRYVPTYVDCPHGCLEGACLPPFDAGLQLSEPDDAGLAIIDAGVAPEPPFDAGNPPEPIDEDPPTEPSVKVMRMALGEMSTCAVLHGGIGEVACWGRSDTLGDGSLPGEDRNVPGVIPDFKDVHYIAAGAYHMCAIKSDQTLWCWGSNAFGELGDNTTITRREPVQVTALEDPVVSVAGGRMFTCAVTQAMGEQAKVFCWGKGDLGQLGNGLFESSMTPKLVSGLSGADEIREVHIGDSHACVVTDDVKLMCWGINHAAQCLIDAGENHGEPINVLEEYDVVSVGHVALGYHHSCAMVEGNKVLCWGSDGFGQMDDGTPGGALQESPVTPTGLYTQQIQIVQSGGHHSCVLDESHKIACWGFNNYGACGTGDEYLQTAQPYKEIDVPDEMFWRRLYTGKDHTCAIVDGYFAYCWGLNSFGQIGDGTNATQRNRAVPVTW
tara:strand:+ start:813 stop:2642 length:1830 start_codon:yes stop_codon:yes gene_type:complete